MKMQEGKKVVQNESENENSDESFEVSEDLIETLIKNLGCNSEDKKALSLDIVNNIFQDQPNVMDMFIDKGFIPPFIVVLKEFFSQDVCRDSWNSIIVIAQYILETVPTFLDLILTDGIISEMILSCDSHMFAITLLFRSFFPPYSSEPSIENVQMLLPAMNGFLAHDMEMNSHLILNCLVTLKLHHIDLASLIASNEVMASLEHLRDSRVRKSARQAKRIVNDINLGIMYEGGWWIFDEKKI